jgi:putative FmdB family regulatory protein
MPTYEYVCQKCGEQFVRIMSFKDYEAGQVACPKCNATEVKQQLSPFISKTSRKS